VILLQVLSARLKYDVKYPIMYAQESESKDFKAFNCVQRGHQNTLEFMPTFLALLLVAGFQYPLVAAGFGAVYTVARIQYFRGYSTGQAAARYNGGARAQWIGFLGLLSCTLSLILHRFFPTYV
jgi:glutathione S-transferase